MVDAARLEGLAERATALRALALGAEATGLRSTTTLWHVLAKAETAAEGSTCTFVASAVSCSSPEFCHMQMSSIFDAVST